MKVGINCKECGHNKGYTLDQYGHSDLAECEICYHVADVITPPVGKKFMKALIKFDDDRDDI